METCAVTGAFGFSGKYITAKLLENGINVRTLTSSAKRQNPFGDKVEVLPFNFDKPDQLVESLKGIKVLYNTYWVRFNHTGFKHSEAVDNSIILFEAAKKAGVERIVHTSITNPSVTSEYEYFRGKAILENELLKSGIPHSILRPAVIFGKEDILINNIIWTIRTLPVVAIFGDGKYKFQPIFVEDYAELAINEGKVTGNRTIDAIGPETLSYNEIVKLICKILGKKRILMHVSKGFGVFASKIVGKLVGDIVLTNDELGSLMQGLLCTDSHPAGTTKLSEWIENNKETAGKTYTSELARRVDRTKAY
jgi:NADH dehydrogenase